ncbi:MAG: aminotransferase class V-fold PLP-dependent enzyme, partial [Candidatus Solibacter sp.]|nr:aminotransferase class V-fold PLP-dependent enzyme [Candidatus Solibacter sp.]
FAQRQRREGIVLKTISFPVPPPSMDDLYRRFEQAVTPRTKMILFCHITNRTGQIFPVRKICQMARERNIPTIVDGAHAFSHFPFKISDLDCDYYGTSLHKWTYAPIGTGFLYVRKSRIASTWSMMASDQKQDNDIRKFEEIGTHPAANHNAISEALIFNEPTTNVAKNERIGYLPEESYLYKFLNAEETLDLYGRLYKISGSERRKRINKLIDWMAARCAKPCGANTAS